MPPEMSVPPDTQKTQKPCLFNLLTPPSSVNTGPVSTDLSVIDRGDISIEQIGGYSGVIDLSAACGATELAVKGIKKKSDALPIEPVVCYRCPTILLMRTTPTR